MKTLIASALTLAALTAVAMPMTAQADEFRTCRGEPNYAALYPMCRFEYDPVAAPNSVDCYIFAQAYYRQQLRSQDSWTKAVIIAAITKNCGQP